MEKRTIGKGGICALVIRLLIGVFVVLTPISTRAQVGSATGSDAEFEVFKQDIRNADKENPAEAERIIKRMESDRAKAKLYRVHPQEIENVLLPLVERMKAYNSSGTLKEFTQARMELTTQLSWLVENNVRPSADTGNKIAEMILDIFAERARFWNHPDDFPMKVAAQYGNSRKVKDYVFGILKGPPGEDRNYLLTELGWSKSFVHDQELYDVLMDLYKKEGGSTALPLAVMATLNREKALPVLLHEIDTTNKIKTFTQDEDILSEYHNPDLLEHPLRRLKDFPKKSWGDIENPTLGIYPDLLLKYIRNAEGEKLELGLTALEQSVNALTKSYPIIREKLRSTNSASRRATAKFLLRSTNIPTFNRPEIADELEAINRGETDPDTKQVMQQAVKQLRSKSHSN